MKKIFIIAAIVLGAVACTKNEVAPAAADQGISFQVASYLNQTKANVEFTGESFGVYAWYDSENTNVAAEQNQPMMVNETVKFADSNWKTVGKTYYWPKTGDVDFFAYAPTAASPWVSCNDVDHKISATNLAITGTEDFMYSSMAMNYNANVDPAKYTDISGVSAGVPILFHHALAKLTVKFGATVLEKDDNKWEITVNKAEFVKVCTKGSLEMSMNSTPAKGVIGWTLPQNSIWTPSTSADDKTDLQAVKTSGQALTTTLTAYTLNEYTVLPQDLTGMKFHINFTIKASNDGGATYYSTETVDRTYNVAVKAAETDPDPAFADAGAYWKMNSKITYNVTIAPNSTNEIYFDPAVEDWATVNANAPVTF